MCCRVGSVSKLIDHTRTDDDSAALALIGLQLGRKNRMDAWSNEALCADKTGNKTKKGPLTKVSDVALDAKVPDLQLCGRKDRNYKLVFEGSQQETQGHTHCTGGVVGH